jgi:HEAT repeat protein
MSRKAPTGETSAVNRFLVIGIAALVAIIAGIYLGTREKPRSKSRELAEELRNSLHAGNPEVRSKAAERLGKMQPLTEANFEALVTAFDDPDLGVRTSVALALVDHAPEIEKHAEWAEKIVPPAARALDDVGKLPIAGADLLGFTGPPGKKTVAALKVQLGHPGPQRKLAGVRALLRLDPETMADVMPVVYALLKSNSPEVRADTLKTVAYLGDKAKPLAPGLVDMVTECPDLPQRLIAAQVLVKINPEDGPKIVPGLFELIREIDRQTGGKLKPATDPSGKPIIKPETAANPLFRVRADTVDLIRAIDPKAAVPN